jgi:hypothetical protein
MVEYKAKGIPGMVSMDRVKSIGAKAVDTPQKAPPSVQLPQQQPAPTRPAPAPAPSLNPIASISEEKARQDLKEHLAQRYPNSFSTQKMLLDAGMRDYRNLYQMPSHPVSDGIMRNLSSRYYPSFSTIWMLYKKNVQDYVELQKK